MKKSTSIAIIGVAFFVVILVTFLGVRHYGESVLGLIALPSYTVALTSTSSLNTLPQQISVVDNVSLQLVNTIPVVGRGYFIETDPVNGTRAYLLRSTPQQGFLLDTIDVSSGATLASLPFSLLNSPVGTIADMEITSSGRYVLISTIDFSGSNAFNNLFIVDLQTNIVTAVSFNTFFNSGGTPLYQTGKIVITPDSSKAVVMSLSSSPLNNYSSVVNVVSLNSASFGTILAAPVLIAVSSNIAIDAQATNQDVYVLTYSGIFRVALSGVYPIAYSGPVPFVYLGDASLSKTFDALGIGGLLNNFRIISTASNTFTCNTGITNIPIGMALTGNRLFFLTLPPAFPPSGTPTLVQVNRQTCAVISSTLQPPGDAVLAKWAFTRDEQLYVYSSSVTTGATHNLMLNFVKTANPTAPPVAVNISSSPTTNANYVLDLETSYTTPNRNIY